MNARISPISLKALALVGLTLGLQLGAGAQTLTHQVDTGGGYSAVANADVGDLYSYRFQYSFPSSGVTYSNASIVAPLPSNVEYLSKGTTSHVDNASYDSGSHTVTFNFVNPLPSSFAGEVFVNVRFPSGTFTGTVGTSNATLNWDADAVPASFTSTPDVQVTAANGASPPAISNGVEMHFWEGADPVYLGSGLYYSLQHGTLGGEIVNSYVIEQAFPKEFLFEWWRHQDPFLVDHSFTVNYSTNLDPSWRAWPGGPFSSNDNSLNNASALALLAGEHVTGLQFDYGTVPAGLNYHIDNRARLTVMGEVSTKNVDTFPNDINGTAIPVGTSFTNTAVLKTAGQYPDLTETETETIDPDIATVDVELRYITDGPYNPNEVVRVEIEINSPPENIFDLVNPTVVDLLPAEFEYVGNVTVDTNTSLVASMPNLASTPNFDGTGRTLITFSWNAGNPLTISPNTEWVEVDIEFDVRVAAATIDGTYNNEVMGWLENATFDCRSNHSLVDVNDFDLDLDRVEELCGDAESFEVFADTSTAAATIVVADAIVSESAATATVSIGLTSVHGTDITVDYATADSTATAGTDYTITSGTATISAGTTSVDVTIPLLGDTLVEGTESFHLNLSNPSGAPIVDGQALVTLNDNDTTSLSVTDTGATEGAASVAVTISITNPSVSAITVDYATADGTATAGFDYTTTTGTATIPAGATSTIVNVPLLDDGTAEGTEAFTMNLSNPVGAPLIDAQATITLGDNESSSLSIADTGTTEGAASVAVTISIDTPSASAVTVDYATVDGSATAGSDYTTTSGTATIAAGATSTIVNVPLLDDGTAEGNEAFSVNLTNPIGAAVADAQATITVTDNESAGLSISDTGVTEGAASVSVTISINNPSVTPVIVDYATADGTATGGSDYTATSGTATIAAGTTSTTINVPVLDDSTVEGSEDFVVNLTNPSGATISDGQATVTLTDNDVTTLSIADASVTEGVTTVAVTVSLANPSANPVSVDYATSDGSASAGTDYTATSGTAVIAAGSTSTVINVALLDDSIAEGSENFVVNLTNPSGAPISDPQSLITMNDNDVAALSVMDVIVAESATSVDVTIQLANASVADVTLDYGTNNGTATSPLDYSNVSGSLTILAGATTSTVTIGLSDDSTSEGNESFSVVISNPLGATIADDTGIVTILDDDDPSISIADIVVSEGAGTADLTVLSTNPSVSDITVDFSTSNGVALAGSDYAGASGTATVLAGDTSATVSITLIDDGVFERNEDFTVTLSNPGGAVISDTAATVVIVDDECDERAFVTEDTSADLSNIDFASASSNLLASNIAANRINGIGYNTTDHFLWGFKQAAPWDTVVRINADYSITEFAIPGLVATEYDTGDVNSSGILFLGKTESSIVKRIDVNPNSPNYLQLLPDLTLSHSRSWADWSFNPLDGNLYTVNRLEVVYRINPSSGLVTRLGGLKRVLGQDLFGATFSDSTGALYAMRDDTGIIYRIPDVHLLTGGTTPTREFFSRGGTGSDRDGARCPLGPVPLPPLRVNIDDVIVSEADGTATLTVSLTRPHSSNVQVDFASFNNTASAGADYTADSGSVTITSGTTTATVDFSLIQDSVPEGQESFFVSITNPTQGILADDVGIVSITDDDAIDTDQDGAPDIDDIDDDDDGILDVDEALVNASCPSNVEVIILLDNSGSISSSEWDSFSSFTRDVIDELGVSGTVRMAVAHYWSDWDPTFGPRLYLESDFTTDPNVAKAFQRRGSLGDELEKTIPLLGNALNGSGTGVTGATSTLSHQVGAQLHLLFMTDARKQDLFFVSKLVDPANPGDPYHFMNQLKVDYDAIVTSIRFDTGYASTDSEANAAAAALASVGGVYTGAIDSNSTDPEGSGTIPRRFYNVNNFGGIPGTLAAEIADLTCESTQDFDGDGYPDHLDIDSDNDGIPDNVEAQSTEGYVPPNGDAGPLNNGLDSAYLGGLTPVDSDQDSVPDVYDADSDNDGASDITENADSDNSVSGNDLDEDGLDNVFDSENVVWDANDHIDDPNPTTLGDIDGDLAADGNNATAMFRDVDFRDPGKQAVYGSWKTLYDFVLGVENDPDENPDKDLYDNLLEYALCLHPGTGLPGPGGFFLEADTSGAIHAKFFRPKGGLTDVTYEIHGRLDLPILETETWSIMFTIPGNGSAGSGITVTDLGNAIEEVRINNLQTFAPVTPQTGFIRLAVKLGSSQTSYTPVWGWTETVVEATQTETYSNPFTKPELLSGEIDAIVGTHGIDLSTATGGVPLDTELTPAIFSYYIEITEGDHAGHRFDVDAVSGSTVTLKADSDIYTGPPYNTYVTPVSIPSTLVGDRFILRAHTTLDDFFPPSGAFTPQAHTFVTGHPADRVYLYDSDWEPYWLYDNTTGNGPFWDLDGDAVFVNAGGTAIPPGGGVFLAPQETTVTLVGLGIVRKNPFAMPLPQGWSLQASPYPLDQSPAERFMNHQTFDGSDDAATSDTVCFWLGNQDTYLPEFRCAFLFDPMSTETPRWLYADDEFLTPRDFETEVFPKDRSSFYFRYNAPKPEYVIPLPWCIGLIGE